VPFRVFTPLLGEPFATAHLKWRKKDLPKAVILKVPHHGAKNAFDLRRTRQHPLNCWDLCVSRPHAVIFAGDFSHPDPSVHAALTNRTNLLSFFDLSATAPNLNPLGLYTPGAQAVSKQLRRQKYCKIIVELDRGGNLSVQQT
jgi:hypothetical protein